MIQGLKHIFWVVRGGLLSILILLAWQESNAQIDPMFTLYRLNPQVLSPAHAGSIDQSEVILLNRWQWSGMEGAPKTFAATANIKVKDRIGLGTAFITDQAGPMSVTTFSQDFAYKVRLSQDWYMTGGIRFSLANIALNFADLRLTQGNDDGFLSNVSTGLKSNAGWGVKFQKKDNGAFLMISQPRIFPYMFRESGTNLQAGNFINVMLGNKIVLNEKLKIYPSALFRFSSEMPLLFDANLLFNLVDKLDVGFNYRNKESIGVRMGFQVHKSIYLGYVYEIPQTALAKIVSQTHEVGLRFSISPKVSSSEE